MVATCRGRRHIWPNPHNHYKKRSPKPWNRRATLWSMTSGIMIPEVFTAWISWTLTLNPIYKWHWRSFSRVREGKEKDVPAHLPPETSTFLAIFRLIWWYTGCGCSGYPKMVSQLPCKNWRQPYSRMCRYVKSMIAITWYEPHTGESGGPRWQHIRSVCSAHTGRTTPD